MPSKQDILPSISIKTSSLGHVRPSVEIWHRSESFLGQPQFNLQLRHLVAQKFNYMIENSKASPKNLKLSIFSSRSMPNLEKKVSAPCNIETYESCGDSLVVARFFQMAHELCEACTIHRCQSGLKLFSSCMKAHRMAPWRILDFSD